MVKVTQTVLYYVFKKAASGETVSRQKCAKQWSVPCAGPFSWLDGSLITYSRWASSPLPGAACGHILRNSVFQWEATSDCNKKLPFICQFGKYQTESDSQ